MKVDPKTHKNNNLFVTLYRPRVDVHEMSSRDTNNNTEGSSKKDGLKNVGEVWSPHSYT